MMTKLLDYLLVCLCAFFLLLMGILGYFANPHAGLTQLITVSVITCAIAAIVGYLGELFEASHQEHLVTAILIVIGIMSGALNSSNALAGFFLTVAACICFILGILADSEPKADYPNYREGNSFG